MNRTHWPPIMAALGMVSAVAYAVDTDEIVKYRRNLMDANGGLMGACNAVLQNKVSDQTRLAGFAQALGTLNRNIATQFPPGSASPDSDALPDVWTRRAEFERRAKDAESKASVFGKTPSAAAFADLSAACKGCHKDFRK
ncbi:MAG: cytochrome c [Gallionellaceae bacterium]|nr:cytochrome c [Gallionellaceae bacterium]